MTIWRHITSFGDSALLLPLIVWIGVWLLTLPPRWGTAARWAAAVLICGGGVALSKLLFMAWGIGPPGLDYTGFSGHTALSLLVWPTLGALIASPRRRMGHWRPWVIALGFAIGGAVAVSRLTLKAHSLSEVLLGATYGVATALWMLRGSSMRRETGDENAPAGKHIAALAIGAVVIGAICYGRVFPSQHVLKEVAIWLSGHADVFSRRRE